MSNANTMNNAIQGLYDDTFTFNRVKGLFEGGTDQQNYEDVIGQMKIINSEVLELGNGVITSDLEEIVDGCIDTLVTTFGMMQILEKHYNIDFGLACKLIAENNLQKYVSRYSTDCKEIIERTIQMYDDQGVEVKVGYDEESEVYYFLDSAGKVRKPFGFKSVDLSSCFKG